MSQVSSARQAVAWRQSTGAEHVQRMGYAGLVANIVKKQSMWWHQHLEELEQAMEALSQVGSGPPCFQQQASALVLSTHANTTEPTPRHPPPLPRA